MVDKHHKKVKTLALIEHPTNLENSKASPSADQLLWQNYTKAITPLSTQFHKYAPRKAAPIDQKIVEQEFRIKSALLSENFQALDTLSISLASHRTQGAPNLSAKKIKPPKAIDGRLDLHGLTQAQAYNATLRFIDSHYHRYSRTIIIITGKGFMRPRDDLNYHVSLAEVLPVWLTQHPLNQYVLSFSIAHVKDGGRGAYYVYLKVLKAKISGRR